MSVESGSVANLSNAIEWVYPYLSAYSKMNGVEFLAGSPSPDNAGGEGREDVERIPPYTLLRPDSDEGAPIREWIEFHARTLLGVMGPPFDAALRDGVGISSRYVVLAAASDAVDEMVYMIGRITQDGRALLFLSEIPFLIKAMNQTTGKQLHMVTRWMAGVSHDVGPAS